MDVEAFLDWEDGSDTRHMLIAGVIVAMAPPDQVHSRLTGSIGFTIRRHMRRSSAVLLSAGLVLDPDTCVVADVAMTNEPPGGSHLMQSPRLIAEVLSPSTIREDIAVKILGYLELASIEEIWAVSSTERSIRLWRRLPEGWLVTLPIRSGTFRSEALDADIALDELYVATDL